MSEQDFTLRLTDLFEGPLDLLLHLVKEQEVEIKDVRLVEVVEAYVAHIRDLEHLDIEVAGDYLVVAATLLAIKSRSLLPREEVDFGDDLLDPEDELIQRLIEYRRFKGASDDLEERWRRRQLEHRRGYTGEAKDNEPERQLDMGELSAWDLLATFSRLMRETLQDRRHHVATDPRPLRWFVRAIGGAVQQRGSATLRDLVEALDVDGALSRESVVGSFCALLELVKIGVVRVEQPNQDQDIRLTWADEGGSDLDELIRVSRFLDEEDEDGDEGDGLIDAPEEGTENGVEGPPEGPSKGLSEEPSGQPSDDDTPLEIAEDDNVDRPDRSSDDPADSAPCFDAGSGPEL